MKAVRNIQSENNVRGKRILNNPPITNGKICNICGQLFKPSSSYARFCTSCRNHSKVFTFSEWMPETGVSF